MSDRIVVMNDGRIEQIGSPTEVYNRPRSAFVADFVGESCIFKGRVHSSDGGTSAVELENGVRLIAAGSRTDGEEVGVLFRPERIRLSDGSGANIFSGEVVERIFVGTAWRYKMLLPDGMEISIRLPGEAHGDELKRGDSLSVRVPPEGIHLFPLEATSRAQA